MRAAINRQLGRVAILNRDLARIRPHHAHAHAESRGFAGPVWPQQADDFPGRNLQANLVDDLTTLVGFAEIVGAEQHGI